MKKLLSIALLLAILGQSCSKHHSNQGSASATVYVAGSDSVDPVLWTNGQPQELDTNWGFGSQVVVVGSDVYVAGVSDYKPYSRLSGPELIAKYTYWQNGAETVDGSASGILGPIAVGVQGNNVYFINRELYENWAVVPLQGLGSSGYVIAAQTVGNDLYLAGCDSIGDGVYWKNGVLHVFAPIPSTGAFIGVYCLYVTPNGDVYVGGTDLQQHGAIWKNGVEITSGSMNGAFPPIRAIFVNGSDVYSIPGLEYTDINGGTPGYWKNGIWVSLPVSGVGYGWGNSIFVAGDDVYVAGTTSQGAVLWKNGVATLLAAHGQANSVVVQ